MQVLEECFSLAPDWCESDGQYKNKKGTNCKYGEDCEDSTNWMDLLQPCKFLKEKFDLAIRNRVRGGRVGVTTLRSTNHMYSQGGDTCLCLWRRRRLPQVCLFGDN